MRCRCAIVLALSSLWTADAAGPLFAAEPLYADGFESPPGCSLTIAPGDSFVQAFADLPPGGTLCLEDGTYHQAMDIPSGVSVRAVHDGMAEIDGESTLGEAWTGGLLQMHGSHSSVRGLRVHHAGTNADTCHLAGDHNTMRVMSCAHGGTQKHKNPLMITGTDHLVEDSWFFGEGRYSVEAFYASRITLRRLVMRPGLAVNAGSSEPRAGAVLYSTDHSLIENSIVLDGASQSVTQYYSGLYVAAHNVDGNVNPPSDNRWLGDFVIDMPDGGDGSYPGHGITIDPDPGVGGANGLIQDLTVRGGGDGVRVIGGSTDFVVADCSLSGLSGQAVVISSIPLPTTTVDNCGADGATLPTPKYVDGEDTGEALFPFPNEALIRRDLCAAGERQSDWCLSGKSLSDYVLDQ